MMLSNQGRRWLNQAARLAGLSTCRVQHGAIIVRGGRVLSVGINSDRNSPAIVEDPKTEAAYHAEQAAIRAYKGSLEGASIYIARTNRKGVWRMSKPCLRCQAAIKSSKIRNVYYTTEGVNSHGIN